MGISSVTEAPEWRHEGSVAEPEAHTGTRAPARLELVRADATGLVFEGREALRAPFLLSPLALVLGALPWLAPSLDPVRAATSGACVLAAAGLAASAWPRRRRVHLAAREPAPGGATPLPPGKLRWVLGAESEPHAAFTTFTVTLQSADGAARRVLENTDPQRLLWQLSGALRHFPGAIDCGWGLAAGACPWSIEPHSGPRSLDDGVDRALVSLRQAPRSLVWMTRTIAGFVVTYLTFLVVSAGAGVATIHPISVILPVALAAALVGLAALLAGWEDRLCVGSRLRVETRRLGARRTSGEVRLESVRGVHAIGAPQADRWHLLIESSDGPLAVSVPRARAAELAHEARRAIVTSRSSPPTPAAQ